MKTQSFTESQGISAIGESAANDTGNIDVNINDIRFATLPISTPFRLTGNETERLVHIVSQAARIKSHYELFLLTQGEIQHFIPHQILISAWGNFGEPNLDLDVISALPGMRTDQLSCKQLDQLVKTLYAQWVENERKPILIDTSRGAGILQSYCNCSFHRLLQLGWSILVHGIVDVRGGSECLYLTANPGSMLKGESFDRLVFFIDPIVAQIDAAFRRVAHLKMPLDIPTSDESPSQHQVLSAREAEIIKWVSEGKSNLEISIILAISQFTVKNHVQRIIKKLSAANRTEAVARYRQICGHI